MHVGYHWVVVGGVEGQYELGQVVNPEGLTHPSLNGDIGTAARGHHQGEPLSKSRQFD